MRRPGYQPVLCLEEICFNRWGGIHLHHISQISSASGFSWTSWDMDGIHGHSAHFLKERFSKIRLRRQTGTNCRCKPTAGSAAWNSAGSTLAALRGLSPKKVKQSAISHAPNELHTVATHLKNAGRLPVEAIKSHQTVDSQPSQENPEQFWNKSKVIKEPDRLPVRIEKKYSWLAPRHTIENAVCDPSALIEN